MKLSDKITALRKSKAMSQEDIAGKLGVSRQAVSRWETGSAMPDATNILQLSKLFNVTADYLLNDGYQDNGLAASSEIKTSSIRPTTIILITLEAIVLLLQFACFIVLQNSLLGTLSMIPLIAIIGGFEYTHRRNANVSAEDARARKLFYKATVWLGAYFPIRALIHASLWLWPRPVSSLTVEVAIAAAYLAAAALTTMLLEKKTAL